MNRKQRRALERQGKTVKKEPVYNMKQSDIQNMKQTAVSEAVDTAMILLLALPIKVLRDEYGWGTKKRLPEFAEKLVDEYTNFNSDEQTLEEYAQMVYEYTGIKFEKNKEEE